MPKITYISDSGTSRTIDVPVGDTVMEGAVQNDVDGIVAECGGNCQCATCHVYVEEKFLPLWHGVFQMAHSVHGASPHWDGQPLETDQVSLDSLKRWLRHWALVRHRDGVERTREPWGHDAQRVPPPTAS